MKKTKTKCSVCGCGEEDFVARHEQDGRVFCSHYCAGRVGVKIIEKTDDGGKFVVYKLPGNP